MKKGQKELKINIFYLTLPIAFYLIYINFNFISSYPLTLLLIPIWSFTLFMLSKERLGSFKMSKILKEKILFYSIFTSFIIIYFGIFSTNIPIIVAQTTTTTTQPPKSCKNNPDCPVCGSGNCVGNYVCLDGTCSNICETAGKNCGVDFALCPDGCAVFCEGDKVCEYPTSVQLIMLCSESGKCEKVEDWREKCKNSAKCISCPSGSTCDPWACNACDLSTCYCRQLAQCGNNRVDVGEECDPPGSTDSQPCSYCSGNNYCTGGTQTRTCKTDCTWGPWSSCSGGTCSCVVGRCGATSCGTTTTTTTRPTTTTTRPTTTTTIPTTTTTIPTTTTINLCGNGKCDQGETQVSCQQDCKTVVKLSETYTYPGQSVIVTVYFNDSRFNISKTNFDAQVNLSIDDKAWPSTYCPISGKRWRQDLNCSMGKMEKRGMENWCSCDGAKCEGKHQNKDFKVTVSQGYGYIEAVCTIPPDSQAGTHRLVALPIIYSEPIQLQQAKVEFIVSYESYFLKDVANFFLNFFKRLTGSFLKMVKI